MNSITFSDQRELYVSRLERRPKVVNRNRKLLGGRGYMHSHPLTRPIWSHPLFTHPLSLSLSLSFSIPDTCRCRSTWWGEIVNDASHRKSGSPGHATPSPCELLFNWALFMKLDVAQNQTCKPAAPGFPSPRHRRRSIAGKKRKEVIAWNLAGKRIFPRIYSQNKTKLVRIHLFFGSSPFD